MRSAPLLVVSFLMASLLMGCPDREKSADDTGDAADTGAGDSGGSGGDFLLASGEYLLTVGPLIAETCGGGLASDVLPEGSTAPVSLTVSGSSVTIESPNPEDLTWVGTVAGDAVSASQVTSADFSSYGYDCVLQYSWTIDATLIEDHHLSGSMGLDYVALSGGDCDALAAEDGGTGFPCGWSSTCDIAAAR
jgi:hypothetical protein